MLIFTENRPVTTCICIAYMIQIRPVETFGHQRGASSYRETECQKQIFPIQVCLINSNQSKRQDRCSRDHNCLMYSMQARK
jgi:hypothetical protein